jgi:FMN phosphatase YigB (HAD superfamily)
MKNKKAIFFDLDGTLLPVNPDRMFKEYFVRLKKSELLSKIADDRDYAFRVFNKAGYAMMENDGSDFNDNVFFRYIEEKTGRGKEQLKGAVDEFYSQVFEGLSWLLEKKGNFQRQVLDTVREKGYRTVLATMPVFPLPAAVSRLKWAGLSLDDFSYVSHYENSRFLKPDPRYYEEILKKTGLEGQQCIMVGNNISEDMSAAALGFEVFLVTGFEIGTYEPGLYPGGGLSDLLDWARALPGAKEA